MKLRNILLFGGGGLPAVEIGAVIGALTASVTRAATSALGSIRKSAGKAADSVRGIFRQATK